MRCERYQTTVVMGARERADLGIAFSESGSEVKAVEFVFWPVGIQRTHHTKDALSAGVKGIRAALKRDVSTNDEAHRGSCCKAENVNDSKCFSFAKVSEGNNQVAE